MSGEPRFQRWPRATYPHYAWSLRLLGCLLWYGRPTAIGLLTRWFTAAWYSRAVSRRCRGVWYFSTNVPASRVRP